MSKGKSLIRSPIFNIAASVVLIGAILIFYKFAVSSNNKSNTKTEPNTDANYGNMITYLADDVLTSIGNAKTGCPVDKVLVEYCGDTFGTQIYTSIVEYLKDNEYSDTMWYELCGVSLHVLYDIVNEKTSNYNYIIKSTVKEDFSLSFVGDISLDDKWNWSPLYVFRGSRSNLGEAAFSSELLAEMKNATVLCVNNEAPLTDGNTRQKGVQFPISSANENVAVLNELGIDIVNIANDHIYDFSEQGFTDTLKALDEADISYIGGGSDLEDAATPRYVIVGGMKIAFVSSARTVGKTMAPEAADNKAGIIYNTNSTNIFSIIKDAKANADYVCAYADWGNGDNEVPDDAQTALAHGFIDSGADIVIGCRSTVLQSVEYYNGKPIVYGLGNFWYETDKHNAVFLRLNFLDGAPSVYCLPCVQQDASTRLALGTDEGKAILAHLVDISAGSITFDENGLLSEVTAG